MRTGTALPKANTLPVQQMANEDPNYLSAYNICLLHEEELAANANKLRCIRILGYLLLNAPNRAVRSEINRCIHSRQDDSELVDFGALFERHVILPLMKCKGRTPTPSHYTPGMYFRTARDQMKVDALEPPKNHNDAKDHALIRDNWRCVVTGVFDLNVPDDIMTQLDPTKESGQFTECAHIIPDSTFFGVNPKSEDNLKLGHSASVLAFLQLFISDIGSFNEEKVHSLVNVITLDKGVHDAFNRMGFYFEATPQENRYETVSFYRLKLHPKMRQFVTFSTIDAERLPVPSRELLSLHATCCKVAHLSGAAEYIDNIYRDAEDMGVLAGDGTSSDMLNFALLSRRIDEQLDDGSHIETVSLMRRSDMRSRVDVVSR